MKTIYPSEIGAFLSGALSWLAICAGSFAAEVWQPALARMPLGANVSELNRTNFAETVLRAFQADSTVKAFILMPGCTDEFYFFKRGYAKITNTAPTLLDAVRALTNQTLVRATFRPPFLLLHTDEDPVEPQIHVEDQAVAERLKQKSFAAHASYNDRDWDFMQPILTRHFTSKLSGYPEFFPRTRKSESWHFFRHSFAAWNLNGWETLEVVSLAGKTVVTIKRRSILFDGDVRTGKSSSAPP